MATLSALEERASVAASTAKTNLDLQVTALEGDLMSADSELNELKLATAARGSESPGPV